MNPTKKIFVACLSVVTLIGCSSGEGNKSADTVPMSADTMAEFNDDDVMFAQMMIPHHEQAIELADMALDPTTNATDDVKALATQIKAAQDPEIATMKQLLSSWGESVEMDSSMDHGDMMTGMLTAEELATLSSLRGVEFDRAWVEAMIAHHEGAIEMALDVMQKGSSPAVKTLADAIITGQEAEIEEMSNLLTQMT